MLTRSSSAEEGWTDTNAYWEPLLVRKAGQTPSSFTEEGWTDTNVTGSSLLRKARCQCLLGSSSAEEGWTDTNAYW